MQTSLERRFRELSATYGKHSRSASLRQKPDVVRAWYRIKKTYEKPHGGFVAIGPRYPGEVSDDGLTVVITCTEVPSYAFRRASI